MNKNFSYIHVEKLHQWGRGKLATRSYKVAKNTRYWGVQGCWEHDMRLISTPNANPKKLSNNEVVCAETEWKNVSLSTQNLKKIACNSPDFIEKKARKLMEEHKILPREDQVKVAMLMMAVSPEFLRNGKTDGDLDAEKVKKWSAGSIKFLRKKYGNRLLCIVIHMDEQNPHMSAYLVPLIKKSVTPRGPRKKNAKEKPKDASEKWVLSCADLFTPDPYRIEPGNDGKPKKVRIGKGTCSLLQDEYAEDLRKENLEIRRGVRRAPHQKGLEHEENRIRYARLSAPIAEVATLNESQLRVWARDVAPQAEESKRAKIERDHYQIAAADAQESVKSLEKKLTDIQRTIPVEEVIASLMGLDPHKGVNGDGSDGKTVQPHFLLPNGQQIGLLPGNKFQNLTPEIPFTGAAAKRLSGKGAIDAITFTTGWSFREATEWLADNFGNSIAKTAAVEKISEQIDDTKDDNARLQRKNHADTITQELSSPDNSRWPQLFHYLTKHLKFRSGHIERLRNDNWIAANKYGHLVVNKGRWDETDHIVSTGKFIIDPRNPETTLKETGDGMFIDTNDGGKNAIISATPIDAFALRASPEHSQDAVFVLGRSPDKSAINDVVKAFKGNVTLAENTSPSGKKIASWFQTHFPAIASLRLPDGISSWLQNNLLHVKKPGPPNQSVIE